MSMRQVAAKAAAPPKTPLANFHSSSELLVQGVFFTYLALIFMLMCLCAKDQKQKQSANGSVSGSGQVPSLATPSGGQVHKESVLLENLCFLCLANFLFFFVSLCCVVFLRV